MRSLMKEGSGVQSLARRSGLDAVVALGLAGLLFFFTISAYVAYRNLQTLQEDNQKILHCHDVIAAMDTLLSDLQDAETGQRGFLLTGNEKYLEPYDAALVSIPHELNDITGLTS